MDPSYEKMKDISKNAMLLLTGVLPFLSFAFQNFVKTWGL